MLNSYKKLSLVVLLGALTLSISSLVKADSLIVHWLSASAYEGVDCPETCKNNPVSGFPIPTGFDYRSKKPLFFICTTLKNGWRAGYNVLGENSCNITVNGKEHKGTKYNCLCTNNRNNFQIFR